MSLAHTPYDGSKQPFTIGLEPLDPDGWLEIDARRDAQLQEKARLIAERRTDVFQEEAGSRAAQHEVAALIRAHLAERGFAGGGDSDEPPLLYVSRHVQEDLCLLQRDQTGWRLTAASLCFPSGWSLREKIGLPMGAIHDDVPGYPGRMADMVARIFDNLRANQPVTRQNWSIYGDDRLYQPQSDADPLERFPVGEPCKDRAFIRVERQTLRRLPITGAILFTIGVHLAPFSKLTEHARGRELAASLRAQLLALTPEQSDYKGLSGAKDRLAAALEAIAAPA